ncbi:MAG: hypothetical protein LBR53_09650 [Deltaproteobacteria bacterium]|jgi:hypothetical protein|nr:hypothetical protein [Deltaproteobacteria bacterium]
MLKHATAAVTALLVCIVLSGFPENAHGTDDDASPTGVASKTKTDSVKHSLCPDKMALDIKILYPQNTGNAEVDAFFEKNALNYIKEVSEDTRNEALAKDYSCAFSEHLYANGEFEASKPNPWVLGVLIATFDFRGGANEHTVYTAYNYDLGTGKEIGIADLFPNGKEGISKYYDHLYLNLCVKAPKEEEIEGFLGGRCGKDEKAPKAFLNLTGSLDKLGHLVLTETGATANFAPYQIRVGYLGPYTLKIPKEDLLAMGANDFWSLPTQSIAGE